MARAIDQFLAAIRQAIYGKDVREAIASGIEQCYNDSTANAQKAEIEAKGAEVLASIPDTYEDLQDDVSDLKSAIEDNGLATPISGAWITGKRMGTPAVGGTFTDTPGTMDGWRYIKIPCTAGQKFIINAHSSAITFRTWAFADENDVCTRYADRTGSEVISEDTVLTVEEGEAYLYINQDSQRGICYDGDFLADRLDDLSEHVDGAIAGVQSDADDALALAQNAVRYDAAQTLTDAQAAQARGNIGAASQEDVSVLASTMADNGLAVPITDGWVENYRMGRVDVGSPFGDPGRPIAGWRYIKIPCTAGQKFIINAHSTSVNFRTWAFADANNVCTRYADRTGMEVISANEALTAEAGEAYLYINQDSQGGTCYRGVYISDQLEALSEHVDDSIGRITEEFADTLNGTITLEHGGISTTYPDGGGSNQKRVYTKDMIVADGYMLVEADEGCTCWIFGYDENGALIGTTSERQLTGPARYVKSPGSRFRLVLAIASSTAGETYQDITDAMFPVVLQRFRVYKPQRTLALCQSADAVPAEWTSASIFQTVGVLGDSWASGSLHHVDDPNQSTTNADLSWPQIMSRQCGMDVTNYTHGGYDVKMWLADTEIGLTKLLSDPVKQLYMIDFGINDYMHSRPTYDGDYPITIGTIDDIKEDYTQNPDTFFGCYGRIIGNILDHAEANGKTTNIILMSVPRYTERGMDANIQQIAEHFSLPYMYLPDDLFFVSQFFVDQVWGGHLLCYGYGGMAAAIQRLLVKCIMKHTDYFGPFYG